MCPVGTHTRTLAAPSHNLLAPHPILHLWPSFNQAQVRPSAKRQRRYSSNEASSGSDSEGDRGRPPAGRLPYKAGRKEAAGGAGRSKEQQQRREKRAREGGEEEERAGRQQWREGSLEGGWGGRCGRWLPVVLLA